MYSSRPVLGTSRTSNIGVPPIIQPAPRITLKTIPKISMTTIWTTPRPSGKENLPPLHPPQRRRRIPSAAYSTSPGNEYTVPARSRVVPPPPPSTAITKPGRHTRSETVPWAQTGKALTPSPPPSTPTPSTPPPSPSPSTPSSPWPTPKLSFAPLPLTGLRSMTTARLAVRDIVLADDVRWNKTFEALDDLHALDNDAEGEYWMWRAEEFQLRARAKAEWKKYSCWNYASQTPYAAKTKPDSHIPPYERPTDPYTMTSLFYPYSPDYDFDEQLYAYSEASDPISVYPITIPTPAEKSYESWLSSDDDDAESESEDQDEGQTGGVESESFQTTASSSPSSLRSMEDYSETSYSLQIEDVSTVFDCDLADSSVVSSLQYVAESLDDTSDSLGAIAFTSLEDVHQPQGEYPHADIFTYETTYEKETREANERTIARIQAQAQAVGPTCDDVDEADYSDGSPSETGLTAFADDEASSQSEVSCSSVDAED
ncbi:hypothetical protein PENSPDRAFT_664602 [Peniophora sp. CONT]|nr:hypothetical protein PENSPDRAFT_664602 [Peniophora sp. CONT]